MDDKPASERESKEDGATLSRIASRAAAQTSNASVAAEDRTGRREKQATKKTARRTRPGAGIGG
jgi:hypothetical protein